MQLRQPVSELLAPDPLARHAAHHRNATVRVRVPVAQAVDRVHHSRRLDDTVTSCVVGQRVRHHAEADSDRHGVSIRLQLPAACDVSGAVECCCACTLPLSLPLSLPPSVWPFAEFRAALPLSSQAHPVHRGWPLRCWLFFDVRGSTSRTPRRRASSAALRNSQEATATPWTLRRCRWGTGTARYSWREGVMRCAAMRCLCGLGLGLGLGTVGSVAGGTAMDVGQRC